MKRIFTYAALAIATLSASATDYTGQLKVNVDGMVLPEAETTVTINKNENQTYALELNNLILTMGGAPAGIGNIVLNEVRAHEESGVTTLVINDNITITEGTTPGIPFWIGPSLGNVPINMRGEIRGEQLYFIIDIKMENSSFGELINVEFGDGGYQIKNSGFEEFHTATYIDGENSYSSDEPNAWHSFNSGIANGKFASLTKFALQNGNTSICNDIRPGSTGSKSVAIESSIVLGFQPDVDGNGDPFHTVLNGNPDSLVVWVKYKQGIVNEEYPYANVSAIITDGTYYQDPEDDKEHTNVVAKAQDKKIESKDFAWQRLSIPFDYDTYAANNAVAKALLVTISTNAQPGVGSNDANTPDSILVDDIELIYNSTVTGINVKGTAVKDFDQATSKYVVGIAGDNADITADDIEVLTDAKGAKVFVDITDIDEEGVGSVANITVLSADLKSSSTYVVNTYTEGYLTGIANVEGDSNEVEAIYNLNGQRVDSPVKGQVYITKYANGKTVKTVKK